MNNNGNIRKMHGRAKRIVLLAVGIIIALALAVTCALCFGTARTVSVDNVQSGDVGVSQTIANPTGNRTGVGSIRVNDVLEYNYNAGSFAVTLPRGRYKLEVWGAQGGTGTNAGGKGGYATGVITTTGNTNFYIVVGGAGANGVLNQRSADAAGGYNGGGYGGRDAYDMNQPGGGGGGATHIATGTANRGLLTNYNSYRGELLAVAGGGGGGGCYGSSNALANAGGGEYGSNGYYGTAGTAASNGAGRGGTQSGGGAAGLCSSVMFSNGFQNLCHNGQAGGFGYGGYGAVNHSGGGGGGGGYFGGGGGGVYDWNGGTGGGDGSGACNNAGGGAGFLATTLASRGWGYGTRAGNGLARITVLNLAPTQVAYTVNGQSLRKASSGALVNLVSSSFATDPDYTNGASGNVASNVYFINSASDFGYTSAKLYLDSACTVDAKDYITYSVTNNKTIAITEFKKLPRAGVNGLSNNSMVLYARIRDNGTNSSNGAAYAHGVYKCTINFNALSVGYRSKSTNTLSGKNNYRYGLSTTQSISAFTSSADTQIYSPSAVGTYALSVVEPMEYGSTVTVSAEDLLNNPSSTYYRSLIVPNSVSGTNPYSYTLPAAVSFQDWTSGSSYTARTGYDSITIKAGRATSNGWQKASWTLYLVEKNSVGALNREPTGITYTKQTIEINFRVENSRPVLRASASNVINVGVGDSTDIKLNTLFEDYDESAGITKTTHQIKKVILPKNEYVQLDNHGRVVSTQGKSGAASGYSFYNIAGQFSYTDSDGSAQNSLTTGRTGALTGFDSAIAIDDATASSNASALNYAFIRYSIADSETLRITGLRSSYSQYSATRTSMQAYTGGTTSSATSSAGVQNPGHFYLLINVGDRYDTADAGIWLPVAITVGATSSTSKAPVSTGESAGAVSGQSQMSDLPTAAGSVNDVFYFTPMAHNIGNTSYPVGQYIGKDGTLTSSDLHGLAIDGDSFASNNGVSGWNGKLNEFLTVSDTLNTIYDSIGTGIGSRYIKAEYLDIYVPKTYFGGRVRRQGDDASAVPGVYYVDASVLRTDPDHPDHYVINGLKITLVSATMNRYFHATVNIDDGVHQVTPVKIAIRVNNTRAEKLDDANVAKGGCFSYDAGETADDMPTVTYRVPVKSTIMITPYDIIEDYNDLSYGKYPTGGFTLNGIDGSFTPAVKDNSLKGGVFTNAAGGDIAVKGKFDKDVYGTATYIAALKKMLGTDQTSAVKSLAANTSFATAPSTGNAVFNDRLFFARSGDPSASVADAYTYDPYGENRTDFSVVSAYNTIGYMDYYFGDEVVLDGTSYDLDFMLINTTTRSRQPAEFVLTVRDRYGDSLDGAGTRNIRIVVEVINTPPSLNNTGIGKLAVTPVQDSVPVIRTDGEIIVSGESGIMRDDDGDTLSFMSGNDYGVIVANTPELASLGIVSFKDFTKDNPLYGKYLVDDYGNLLADNYVSAEIVTSSMINVHAVGSTKNISGGVYVYFFVSDGYGGETLGYKQIEVTDSPFVFNTGADGFDRQTKTWATESTSTADITRDRYIVGSTAARDALKEKRGATDADVKLIATDPDKLQGIVLSPWNGSDYVNLVSIIGDDGSIAYDYESAVPSVVRQSQFGGSSAVRVYSDVVTSSLPANYTAELMFLTDGVWKTSAQVVTELTGKNLTDAAGELDPDVGKYFDIHGRWIVTDWALRLRAASSLENRVCIDLSLRDEAKFGGDTAGVPSAYTDDRNAAAGGGKTIVACRDTYTVYQTITDTGIRTKDEFVAYDNYFVVEDPELKETDGHGNDRPVAYLSTYDGDTTSQYASALSTLAYTGNGQNKVLVDASTAGVQVIKQRSSGAPDNTKAGLTSGINFYDATAADKTEGYQYPTVIEVPGNRDGSGNYQEVYIPMSYFGVLSSIVTADDDGNIQYAGNYVGYDVRTGIANAPFDRIDVNSFAVALTVSDGERSWSGASLKDNPYITISAFDENGETVKSYDKYFSGTISEKYYNNRLAVTTVNANGNLSEKFENNIAANGNSFVGNGRMMYLEEQETKLQEHNFGLIIKKNKVRTGSSNITLTVKLAKSNGGRTAVGEKEQNTAARSVSVNIKVYNTPFDLVTSEAENSLKYDATSGVYYYDVSLPSATSKSVALLRSGSDSSSSFGTSDNIYYSDADYKDSTYRDNVYFSSDSFGMLSGWSIDASGRLLPRTIESGKFVNTVDKTDGRAQSSMLNYYGVGNTSELGDVGDSYTPNPGKYGSNTEGYSDYFTVSLSQGGSVMNIMASRKTFINESAFKNIYDEEYRGKNVPGFESFVWNSGKAYGGMSMAQVEKVYASRGLVVLFDGSSTDSAISVNRVYYPLKALVYDSCGAGWNEATFVALELRVTVENATPTLRDGAGVVNDKTGEREYEINLAVGDSVRINLYDIVRDPDIYVKGSETSSGVLATEADFSSTSKLSGITSETGDYLRSMYSYIDTGDNVRGTTQEQLENGSGGLSRMPSDYVPRGDENDVVMWLETNEEYDRPGSVVPLNERVPLTNRLGFTVYRRTSGADSFKFKVYFCDNHSSGTQVNGKYVPNAQTTEYITFIVNVTNQAPVIVTEERYITMRKGDEFTILATYYDTFIGGVNGGSIAYNASDSKIYYANRAYKDTQYGNNVKWQYEDITNDYADKHEFIPSSLDIPADTFRDQYNNSLGFIGLANDDTPWRLRIWDVQEPIGFWQTQIFNQLSAESKSPMYSSYSCLALRITAGAACTDLPLTVTVIDGEGGTASYTFYITIVSSKPTGLDPEDDKSVMDAAHLEYVNGEHAEYRLFGIPTGDREVSLNGFDDKKHAYSSFDIPMTAVAKDPDGTTETENMRLYGGGMFTVNGVALKETDGVYKSDYFEIEVDTKNGSRSFNLRITGYNPDSAYETLTFYVADPGNGAFSNALLVTIRVYTLYSDMQNPDVAGMNAGQYAGYLGGSNKVYVQSYDDYTGINASSDTIGESSYYAYIDINGNDGNHGNTSSPIVDPDVQGEENAQYAANVQYSAKLYAFITGDGTSSDTDVIKGLFTTDGAFRLKSDVDSTVLDRYLVGGVDANGSAVEGNVQMTAFVNRYVEFAFAMNGTGISFRPNTSTLNYNIMMYIEVVKQIGSRETSRSDAIMSAGTLFSLVVRNSAPRPGSSSALGAKNLTFTGVKGDSIEFKVHDKLDPTGSLFCDSDIDDTVTVFGFDNPESIESYKTALDAALKADPTLDWAADAANGKSRAITVAKAQNDNGDDVLKITINRRMDATETINGKTVYKDRVTFPLAVIGKDTKGDDCVAVIDITVCNSPVSAVDEYSEFDSDGVGYELIRESEKEFVIDAKVLADKDVTVNLADIMLDDDFVAGSDADSYMFAPVSGKEDHEYLLDKPVVAYYYEDVVYDKKFELAEVAPIGSGVRFTGFRISAISTERNLQASILVRVVDRSTQETDVTDGVFITLNITIMNNKPYVKDSVDGKPIVMLGSDMAENLEYSSFSIADFVGDPNDSDVVGEASADHPETYLRIVSVMYLLADSLYCSSAGDAESVNGSAESGFESSSLFTLQITDDYRQSFMIHPKQGFYGTGTVEITVADGDAATRHDTLTVSFSLNVQIVYNPDEIDELNSVSIARGKKLEITIDSIIPDIENTLKGSEGEGDDDTIITIPTKFNPSSAYKLVSVEPFESNDPKLDAKDYIDVIHEDGGADWFIRAKKVTSAPKQVKVTYTLKTDESTVYTQYFTVTIVENAKPRLLYGTLKFLRYNGETETTFTSLDTSNRAHIRAEDILDDPENDELTFIDVKSQKPSLVSAYIETDEDGVKRLVLKFTARGESEITISVADETGEAVSRKFVAINEDLPAPSFMTRLAASFEGNTVMWIVIICCVALLLLILIIIIAVAKKRKRAREELEALLVSEMEIEEQMLKLAGGPAPTDYQSFGYLPPVADEPTAEPNMMLGEGMGDGNVPPFDDGGNGGM